MFAIQEIWAAKQVGEKINDNNNNTTFLKLKWVCKSKIHQLLIPRVLNHLKDLHENLGSYLDTDEKFGTNPILL